MNKKTRVEKDVLGELEIPEEVYWGINTQRAIRNFNISGKQFPTSFITALANVKKACLLANVDLGLIEDEMGKAIKKAIDEIIINEKHLDQFPVDIFQSGSGTQTNMNMNEVLANRANEILGYPKGEKKPVHPNDHVNKAQSSNDVIPTSMHLSILASLKENLFPALKEIQNTLSKKISEFQEVVKVGRTHLQDAVPIPLSLEFEVYRKQIEQNEKRLYSACEELYFIPLGGTAVGTGINIHQNFSEKAISHLSTITDFPFKENPVKAEGIASHNSLVKLSGILKTLALSLLKMANDIRWMGSGPRAGLGELIIPQNEPGSSIMPGKINPTQAEMLIQVCIQIIGNDTTISFAEGYGSTLDLNVTKPLMISILLDSINLLSNSIVSFSNLNLKGLQANLPEIQKKLSQSLMIITKLTPILGYDVAAEIVQEAYQKGKTVKEILEDKNVELEEDIDDLLDPRKMV